MRVIAVDDGRVALGVLAEDIAQAEPDAEIITFTNPYDAIAYAETAKCDVAFLDIQMYGMTGLELAKRLKDITANMNIIFVTGYSEYSVDAFSVRASGYVLKPSTPQQVRTELDNLRFVLDAPKPTTHIRVQTFGNFEVFSGACPIRFERSKSKEIFAYLVDRRGAGCTVRELAAVLFEDREYDSSIKNQIQTFISSMMKTLAEAGAENLILRRFNSLSLDINQIDCDYYRFLNWDISAVNSYAGEYMNQYSWAEFRAAFMDARVNNNS